MYCMDQRPSGEWFQIAVDNTRYSRYLINHLEAMVRETAYNVCRLEADGFQGEEYSRAADLYRTACRTLKAFSPAADTYISETYNPRTVTPFV